MRIRRSPGTPHNALNVLQTVQKKNAHRQSTPLTTTTEGNAYEGIHQNRVIQSPNPGRIQRLTVKNLDTLQESQRLHPLQPSRLGNVRRHSSGFRALAENLRGRMTRVASSGKGERAGRGGGGLGPGVQTRCWSRKSKDVGQHFFSVWYGVSVRGKERRKGEAAYVMLELSVKHGKRGGWGFCHASHPRHTELWVQPGLCL